MSPEQEQETQYDKGSVNGRQMAEAISGNISQADYKSTIESKLSIKTGMKKSPSRSSVMQPTHMSFGKKSTFGS